MTGIEHDTMKFELTTSLRNLWQSKGFVRTPLHMASPLVQKQRTDEQGVAGSKGLSEDSNDNDSVRLLHI